MDIKVKSLNVILGGNQILSNIDLHGKKGKFLGVIGPNGSGKSTLLKCIYRTLQPHSGVVFLNDKDLRHYSIRESAKKIAVVSQHNNYSFDFSVAEMVLMGRSPHKKMMERDNPEDFRIVEESLNKVGMLEFSKRSFSSLSGGEQQRIILARALAQKTDCIILDEPTNHLDIKYQIQLMNIVKELGVTIISAIHDLNLAAAYCDEIYALKNGQVFCSGTPAEVLTSSHIQQLYEVDAKVLTDEETGQIQVVYKPR